MRVKREAVPGSTKIDAGNDRIEQCPFILGA
jgi:hypothetical protein